MDGANRLWGVRFQADYNYATYHDSFTLTTENGDGSATEQAVVLGGGGYCGDMDRAIHECDERRAIYDPGYNGTRPDYLLFGWCSDLDDIVPIAWVALDVSVLRQLHRDGRLVKVGLERHNRDAQPSKFQGYSVGAAQRASGYRAVIGYSIGHRAERFWRIPDPIAPVIYKPANRQGALL